MARSHSHELLAELAVIVVSLIASASGVFFAMSDQVAVAVIGAFVSVVGTCAAIFSAYLAYKAVENARAATERAGEAAELSRQNHEKIEIVHKATNSIKDELVTEVRKAAFAAGQKDATDKKGT